MLKQFLAVQQNSGIFFFLFITFQRRSSTIPVTTSCFFIKSKAAGFQPEPTLNIQPICTEILRKGAKKTYYCLNSPTFWLSPLSCAKSKEIYRFFIKWFLHFFNKQLKSSIPFKKFLLNTFLSSYSLCIC